MKFYICGCFYEKNIFIKKLGRHFTFKNEDQFRQDYEEVLKNLNEQEERSLFDEGKKSLASLKKKVASLKSESSKIQFEIARRKSLENDSHERKKIIQKEYTKLHWEIYYFDKHYLQEAFHEVVNTARRFKDRSKVTDILDVLSKDKKIYGFQMFTPEFCQRFLKELDNFEKSPVPKERPNSMNQYGVLLDELGFSSFITELRMHFLEIVIKRLYPELCVGRMDSHRAFIVNYKLGQDVELHEHFDNSEVTLNVCLGKIFTGGELFFGGMKGDSTSSTYSRILHDPGYAILHRGQQLHGALPITDGERCNLIIWLRASVVRNEKCPMCDEKPDLLPAEGFGDGFTSPSDHNEVEERCCIN